MKKKEKGILYLEEHNCGLSAADDVDIAKTLYGKEVDREKTIIGKVSGFAALFLINSGILGIKSNTFISVLGSIFFIIFIILLAISGILLLTAFCVRLEKIGKKDDISGCSGNSLFFRYALLKHKNNVKEKWLNYSVLVFVVAFAIFIIFCLKYEPNEKIESCTTIWKAIMNL